MDGLLLFGLASDVGSQFFPEFLNVSNTMNNQINVFDVNSINYGTSWKKSSCAKIVIHMVKLQFVEVFPSKSYFEKMVHNFLFPFKGFCKEGIELQFKSGFNLLDLDLYWISIFFKFARCLKNKMKIPFSYSRFIISNHLGNL